MRVEANEVACADKTLCQTNGTFLWAWETESNPSAARVVRAQHIVTWSAKRAPSAVVAHRCGFPPMSTTACLESTTPFWRQTNNCMQLLPTQNVSLICYSRVGVQSDLILQDSSHHLFSSLTFASSSGVKSLTILKVFRISSGVLPLIIDATFAHVRSRSDLISI